MSIPFLLADGRNIFHTLDVKIDTESIHQYYLLCFLYQLLDCKKLMGINLEAAVTINDLIIETNTFSINGRSFTPTEVFSSLADRLPGREFKDCKFTEEYATMLQLTLQYAGLYGILSSTTNGSISNKINSEFWNTTARDLESYKPSYHQEVIEAIMSGKPSIVTGGTGTGKTEVIPKLFFYYYRIYTSDRYFITQKHSPDVLLAFPRKVLATGTYISYNEALGYTFNPDISPLMLLAGGERVKAAQAQRPRFMIGTSESLYSYASSCGLAIIDEFHEHDLKSDIFFSLLYKNNKQIIAVTATPSDDDRSLFPKFLPSAARIHIAGSKSYAIKTLKLPNVRLPSPLEGGDLQVPKNYREIAESIIVDISPMITYGTAALLFLPKVRDVDVTVKSLKSKLRDFTIIGFYSTVSIEASRKIKEIETKSKLIIIATQAAESSITFPTLLIMIDSGLEIRIITTPTSDYRSYEISSRLQYINQFQATQRKGRVGRNQIGNIGLMYDPKTLSTISPNILDGNLTTLVIMMKKFNLTDDELFVVLTEERRSRLKRVQEMVEQLNIDLNSIELRFLKNIYWLESLSYFSNHLVPVEDKELYMQLWEEDVNYTEVYNKIQFPSFIPRRRIIFAYKDNKGLHFVEEKTRTRVIIAPNKSIQLGRIFYDQISIFFLIAL